VARPRGRTGQSQDETGSRRTGRRERQQTAGVRGRRAQTDRRVDELGLSKVPKSRKDSYDLINNTFLETYLNCHSNNVKNIQQNLTLYKILTVRVNASEQLTVKTDLMSRRQRYVRVP